MIKISSLRNLPSPRGQKTEKKIDTHREDQDKKISRSSSKLLNIDVNLIQQAKKISRIGSRNLSTRSSEGGQDPKAIRPSRQIRGWNCGITKPECMVITSEQAYDSLWSSAFDRFPNRPEKRMVDFEFEQVIAVFLGNKDTTGTDIQIMTKITKEENDEILVHYKVTAHAPGDAVLDTPSQPFHIVYVRKSGRSVIFKELQDSTPSSSPI